MKNQFAFLQLTNTITGIISLPMEAKLKKNPFVIVNTDNNRGLYVKKLEQEIAKYKNLSSENGETKFHDIQTSNLIVFGDSPKFDYRTEMNYITLNSLVGKDVKVFDLVDDYSSIVRRLATYCKNNGVKRLVKYRDDEDSLTIRINIREEEPKKKVICPCVFGRCAAPKAEKTLVNVYSKPDVKVEKITVHSNWVKVGYNQYDIYVDLFGSEFIVLEDGDKLFVKEDRFGRRYLAV